MALAKPQSKGSLACSPQLDDLACKAGKPRRTGQSGGADDAEAYTDQEMMDFLAERSYLACIATVRAADRIS